MFKLLQQDIAVFHSKYGTSILSYLYYPAFSAIILLRLSRWFYLHHCRLAAYALTRLNDLVHGIWVGPQVEIGPGLFLAHSRGLVVNPQTKIGSGCTILQNVALGGPGIVIGNNVTLGAGALIIANHVKKQGLRIGDGAFIGAGAVVVRDVPANAVMVGNPARNIRTDSTAGIADADLSSA